MALNVIFEAPSVGIYENTIVGGSIVVFEELGKARVGCPFQAGDCPIRMGNLCPTINFHKGEWGIGSRIEGSAGCGKIGEFQNATYQIRLADL